jgi:hypothetical protein
MNASLPHPTGPSLPGGGPATRRRVSGPGRRRRTLGALAERVAEAAGLAALLAFLADDPERHDGL